LITLDGEVDVGKQLMGMGNLLPKPKGDPGMGMAMSRGPPGPGLGNLKLVNTAWGDPCKSGLFIGLGNW